MCHAIYGIGLIAIRMRERYKGGVRGHKNEGVYSWQKTALIWVAERTRAGDGGVVVMG